jgi:hypothetical protein
MKKDIFLLVITIVLFNASKAQFKIEDINAWDKIKGDTTYVLMDSVTSPKNNAVKDFFKQYWKISTVKFIESGSFQNYLSLHASYLSLVYQVISKTLYLRRMTRDIGTVELSFQLWACKEKYFKKDKKWKLDYLNTIGKLDIYLPSIHDPMGNSIEFDRNDFPSSPKVSANPDVYEESGGQLLGVSQDVTGTMCWGKGVLKNYIQILNYLITIHKNGELRITNNDIKNLKVDTLHVPDYIRKTEKYRVNMTGHPKEVKTKELFDDYLLNHATGSAIEFNKRILNTKNDFYYLIYVGRLTSVNNRATYTKSEGTIGIVNGLTGEVVYTEDVSDFDSSDMKQIYKEAMKN